jgi:hypothetical protein
MDRLKWLLPLAPEDCMETLEGLPDNLQPPPSDVLELFNAYPELQTCYLQRRIFNLVFKIYL